MQCHTISDKKKSIRATLPRRQDDLKTDLPGARILETMSEEPRPRDPLRAFTRAGRLLVVATIIVAAGLFYWCVMFINDYFPSGRYPLAFFLIPVFIGASIFFGIVSLILRIMGIRVWRETDKKC